MMWPREAKKEKPLAVSLIGRREMERRGGGRGRQRSEEDGALLQ